MAVAASAVAGLVIVTVGAALLMTQGQAAYQATLNPTPQAVNIVLPDAESLAQGRALYTERCAPVWAGQPDEETLHARMPRLRDEDLYTLTGEGWLRLPPCEGDLSATERWHIVNYLRAQYGAG
jgi:hypothetical protein